MGRVDLYYPAFPGHFENLASPINPPLGLMHLAAVLREAGHTCRIADLRLEARPDRALERLWAAYAPDVIGVSSVTHMASFAYELIARCKRRFPDVPVMIGGPHVSAYREAVLKDCHADVAVRGEGEPVIAALVASLVAGALDRGLPNLLYRRGDEVVESREVALIEDLNALPAPAWDLGNLGAYAKRHSMALLPCRRYASILSSRGCPYRCTYCHHIFGKRMRFVDPARFVDQLEHLVRAHGVNDFEIVDDIFNVDRKRVLDICAEIVRRGMKVRLAFPNGLRADLLDREVIDALHDAGTRFICFPIESASPRIQRMVRKDLDLAKAEAAIDYAESKGIVGCGFFMMGFPGETVEELQRTFDFAVGSRLLIALFSIVTPYRGTELGEELASKLPFRDPCDYTYLNFEYGLWSAADIPIETIARMRAAAWRRFYARPSRVARLLRIYPGLTAVPRMFAYHLYLQLHQSVVRLTRLR